MMPQLFLMKIIDHIINHHIFTTKYIQNMCHVTINTVNSLRPLMNLIGNIFNDLSDIRIILITNEL